MAEVFCSVFQGFNNPIELCTLSDIAKDIIRGKYRDEVEKIRTLTQQGLKEEADKLKKQLLAFTPSAAFVGGRKIDNIVIYTKFIVLDLDKLEPDQLEQAFYLASNIPYTYCCFRSPSGNGLKILVEVTSNLDQHTLAYNQVADYYEENLQQKIDRSGKDVTRLCFMSFDENAYESESWIKFNVDEFGSNVIIQDQIFADTLPLQTFEEKDAKWIETFLECEILTQRKSSFVEGNRNNYLYLLACNCNRAGIPESMTSQLMQQNYELPFKQFEATIKSAYTHHSKEFAKVAKSAKSTKTAKTDLSESPVLHEEEVHEDYLKTTPVIPDWVFDTLPYVLKEGASAFSDRRKRDVYFTSALAILSGCLPNVTGVYFQERVHPHLYTFVIAPPASGKGVLKNAKRLADKYHQKILEISREGQKKHEAEMVDYKELQRKRKKGDPAPEKPETPPFKIVFIPADCSHSRMIEHLQNNGGNGIICETEADTMSGAKKQDWGDYSPTLRAAFHHEKITFTRKTNNEYIEINDPRLAMALSGTPAQAPKLISSAEDGLFSRLLFYAYKNEIVWQDPSPFNKTVVFNDHFENLSAWVLEMIGFLEQSPTDVHLSQEQWIELNQNFARLLADVTIFTGEEASGVVYRLGLIMFRICMVFTALRKVENGETTLSVQCSDEDFRNALALVQTYLQHSILMFNNLPKQNDTISFQGGDYKRKFFDSLPHEFTRKQAVELGTQYKLAARTVDDILKTATGSNLEKVKAGLYQKKVA